MVFGLKLGLLGKQAPAEPPGHEGPAPAKEKSTRPGKSALTVNEFVARTKRCREKGLEPTKPELIAYARYLGIDPVIDADLMWIVDESLNAPLPSEWTEHHDSAGRVFYYNVHTHTSSWTHPLEQLHRDTYKGIVNFRSGNLTKEEQIAELDKLRRECEEAERDAHKELQAWTEHIDEQGQKFYNSREQQRSYWTDPRPARCHALYLQMKALRVLAKHCGQTTSRGTVSTLLDPSRPLGPPSDRDGSQSHRLKAQQPLNSGATEGALSGEEGGGSGSERRRRRKRQDGEAGGQDAALASRETSSDELEKVNKDPWDLKRPNRSAVDEVGRTRVYFKSGVLESLEERRALLLQAAATQLARIARGSQRRRHFLQMRRAALRVQTAQRMGRQRKVYLRSRAAVVACQAFRRSVLARRVAFQLKQQRCATRLQAYQRRRIAMRAFAKARRAAVRLQAAFRRWAGRKQYLLDLANFKEQAKLENQVKALQAKLEAKEREAASARQAGGQAEPPAEILEMLNTLTAENSKLRGENERQRAEIEKLREENRHLRAERASKDELLNFSRRAHREAGSGSFLGAEPLARRDSKPQVPHRVAATAPPGGDADAVPNGHGVALQLCPPLSHFWEDVPSEMIPLLKNDTEVHIKLGSHVLMVDEKDHKGLTWKSWMARSRGYRRSMAFHVERRNLTGDAVPRQPELGDDNSIGAAFSLRSAFTSKYVLCSSGMMDRHCLRVTGSKPEEAAVFTCIPLLEDSTDEVGIAAEYLCSIRLLSEKRFLRLRTDGHVAMTSVSDPDSNIRHDKMAVTIEKLLPRASYEIVVDEDLIGIMLSKDLPLRVCGITSMAEPSCAERSGRVHVGDLLTSVNGQDIAHIPLGDVVPMINCKKPVTLGFTVARDLTSVVGLLPAPREKESTARDKQRSSLFSGFGKRSKVANRMLEMTAQMKSSGDVIEL